MEYTYRLLYRPFEHRNCPQHDFLRWENDGSIFGMVTYSDRLLDSEIKHYSLSPISEMIEASKLNYANDYYDKITIDFDPKNNYCTVHLSLMGEHMDSYRASPVGVLSDIRTKSYRII